MTLVQILADLDRRKCSPSLYKRGPHLWRAHINRAGNYWADARTPTKAFQIAYADWRYDGRPMDGDATDPDEN